MEKLIILSCGAFLGFLSAFLLVFLKDMLSEYRLIKSDSKYLAVRVVDKLNTFSNECFDFITHHTHDKPGDTPGMPNLILYDLNVNWNSVSLQLMFRVLALPKKLERCRNIISGAIEISGREDHSEAVKQFAILSLEANHLIATIIHECNTPELSAKNWRKMEEMAEVKKMIEGSQR